MITFFWITPKWLMFPETILQYNIFKWNSPYSGTYHIYQKQKDSLKPQIILIIINLIDTSLYSIALGLYIYLLRSWDFDKSSTAHKIFQCVVLLLGFFKSMDNILGQLDTYLAISKPNDYRTVIAYNMEPPEKQKCYLSCPTPYLWW